MDSANNDAAAAGPTARARDVRLWFKPIVEPKALRVGAALVMKMLAQPTEEKQHNNLLRPEKHAMNARH
jgi:hypothetical protein